MIVPLDVENATIEKALVFYQQHLISEQNRNEHRFPRNGKSVLTSEDLTREQEYDAQVRAIAAIIEKRSSSHGRLLEEDNPPKPARDPALRETEPYVNPFTDQWIIPENMYTPGPSNPSYDSGRSVNTFKSVGSLADQVSRAGSELMAYQPISGATSQVPAPPVPRAQSRTSSGTPSITRKPVNPSTRLGHYPVTSQVSVVAGSNAFSDANRISPATPSSAQRHAHDDVELPGQRNFMLPSTPNSLNSSPAIVDLTATNGMKPLPAEQEHGSFNGMEAPWTLLTGSTKAAVEAVKPVNMDPTQLSREPSWQAATWTHVMSNVHNNSATPVSMTSQQSHETNWNMVPPAPPAKLPISTHPYEAGRTQDHSKSYYSMGETAVPPYVAFTQHPTQHYSAQSFQEATRAEITYRQPPAFNATKLGSFPNARLQELPSSLGDRHTPAPSMTHHGKPPAQRGIERTADFTGTSDVFTEPPAYGKMNSSNTFSLPSFSNAPSAAERATQPATIVGHHPQISAARAPESYSMSQNYTQHQAHHQNGPMRTFAPSQARLPSWSSTQATHSPNLAYHGPDRTDKDFSHSGSGAGYAGSISNQLRPNTFTFSGESRTEMGFQSGVPKPRKGSGPQEDVVPNRLNPLSADSRNHASSGHDYVQPKTTNWSKVTDRPTAHLNSKPNVNDSRTARSFAERADQKEREALQRMQDDWNREEDTRLKEQEAFARHIQDEWNSSPTNDFYGREGLHPASPQYGQPRQGQSAGRLPQVVPTLQRHKMRQPSNDSIKFAASPDGDTGEPPPPPIVVKIPRTTSVQRKQPPIKRNLDATKAAQEEIRKFEEAERAREAQEKQAKIAKEDAARAALRAQRSQVECTVCGDPSDDTGMVGLPCNHPYHGACLANAFRNSLASGKVFICCSKTPVPVELAAPFLPDSFVANYKAKMIERATPNPIYCPQPGCSTFIAPGNLKGDMAICPKCTFVSCRLCKNPEHRGTCPPDKNGKRLLDLASNKNWTQCKRCNVIVERDEGCLHMTCSCGHEFCYSCGGKWETCRGKCPRKS